MLAILQRASLAPIFCWTPGDDQTGLPLPTNAFIVASNLAWTPSTPGIWDSWPGLMRTMSASYFSIVASKPAWSS